MRKFNKVVVNLALIIVIQAIFCIRVLAAESNIILNGENSVEIGKVQTISIKVANDEKIGVIIGTVSGDANIEIINVEAKDKNWVVNYNSTTKQFDGFCADGTNNGEIIDIKYKIKENAKQGIITLSDIELTTISYNTIKKGIVEKTIVAKAETSDAEKNDEKEKETIEENKSENKDAENKEDKKSDNKADKSNNSKNDNNDEIEITAKGDTGNKFANITNKIIPNLGQSEILLIGIISSGILAIVSYRKLNGKNRRD